MWVVVGMWVWLDLEYTHIHTCTCMWWMHVCASLNIISHGDTLPVVSLQHFRVVSRIISSTFQTFQCRVTWIKAGRGVLTKGNYQGKHRGSNKNDTCCQYLNAIFGSKFLPAIVPGAYREATERKRYMYWIPDEFDNSSSAPELTSRYPAPGWHRHNSGRASGHRTVVPRPSVQVDTWGTGTSARGRSWR